MFLYQKIKLQCLCFHVGSGQRIPDPVEEGSDPVEEGSDPVEEGSDPDPHSVLANTLITLDYDI